MEPVIVKHTFSKLDNFETCPRQYEARYVLKNVPFVPSDESLYGDRFHKAMEERLCFGDCLPNEFKDYEDIIDGISKLFDGDKYCELQLAMREDGSPCGYNDPDYFVRGNVDHVVIDRSKAWAFDWKTGKVKRTDQLTLMALLVLANFPEVQYVRTSFVFFRYDEVIKEIVLRKQFSELWAEFKFRMKAVEIAVQQNKFIPKPSGLCRKWCPVKTCEHCGK